MSSTLAPLPSGCNKQTARGCTAQNSNAMASAAGGGENFGARASRPLWRERPAPARRRFRGSWLRKSIAAAGARASRRCGAGRMPALQRRDAHATAGETPALLGSGSPPRRHGLSFNLQDRFLRGCASAVHLERLLECGKGLLRLEADVSQSAGDAAEYKPLLVLGQQPLS